MTNNQQLPITKVRMNAKSAMRALGLGGETTVIQQLAFEGGEKALAHGAPWDFARLRRVSDLIVGIAGPYKRWGRYRNEVKP